MKPKDSNRYPAFSFNLPVIMIGMLVTGLWAQNRGNDLAFQGWDNLSPLSAIAVARGSAFTAIGGAPEALYYNPAGLASIKHKSLTFSGAYSAYQWSENQNYYPNRLFFTLPFYLEGLYILDPVNNGKHDYDIFFNGLPDTAYQVTLPDTGLEPYSDKAADWIKKSSTGAPAYLSIAYPFTIAGKKGVIALAWSNNQNFVDYDRNDTYLDPHIGYIEYNMPRIVNGLDTVRMEWSRFERKRSGSCQALQSALGVRLNSDLQVGLGIAYWNGTTTDRQVLQRIGYFQLFDQNDFAFSYDTLDQIIQGDSKFSALKVDLGLQLAYEAFGAGIDLRLPYRLKKTSRYEHSIMSPQDTVIGTVRRLESLDLPLCWTVGIYLRPISDFTLTLDYSYNPYSQIKAHIVQGIVYRPWVDQKILSWGLEYQMTSFCAIRGGYQTIPQVFVPDGAVFRDRGPRTTVWSTGMGIKLGKLGIVDWAWELRTLKYFDQYFSNVNYSKLLTQKLLLSYTYIF